MMPAPGRVRFARLARLFGAALALYARLVARTAVVSGEVTREQVVLAFWHEFNLAVLVVALRRRSGVRHASFSTRGFRGIVITTMLERCGVRVFPLPPPGDRAVARDFALRMGALGRQGYSLVVTPDGPFGPYQVAKPGALIVARAAGLPIVTWAVTARPAIRLRSRWDRQVVPLPFSRLRVVAHGPIPVATRERLGARLPHLQAALDDTVVQAGRR